MKKFFMAVIAMLMTASVSAQFYIYLSNGDILQADSISMVFPGMLSGEFSVSDTKKVHFSKGNLQATYDGSGWTWSFATNQWDYIGNAAANNAINGNGTVSSNGIVDLFGWSTAANYYGIENSTDYTDYSGNFEDWGNNPISNGGNTANMWHTLKTEEWVYLFYDRTDAAKLFSLGKVNGVPGTILLPDNWAGEKFDNAAEGLTDKGSYYYNSNGNNFNLHTYSGDAWEAMEKAGAIFLPAAGLRYGTDVYDVKSLGYYWSATLYGTNDAYSLNFDSYGFGPQGSFHRIYGRSVRLVR